MTQKADVAQWLDVKGSLTRAQAFTELGIAELSARIIELEADGYEIPRRTIEVRARNGRRCRVTEYLRPTRYPAPRDIFSCAQ